MRAMFSRVVRTMRARAVCVSPCPRRNRATRWPMRAPIIVTTRPYPVLLRGVKVAHRLDDILPECDVLNLLRIQFERQRKGLFPSINEYAHLFGMNGGRLRRARPDILLLAPGPINRGVEITPEVADGPWSLILKQVESGLAVRMAVLFLVAGGRPPAREGA